MPFVLSAQWFPNYIHSDNESDFYVINADTIVSITGGGGRVYHSYDGGNSWLPYQTIFNGSWFTDIDFPSSNVGYACGGTAFGPYSNVIIKTEDSGLTWDSLTANNFSGMSLTNIAFVDNEVGLVSGEVGLMLRTTDGGASFQSFSLPNNETVSSIKVIQDSVFLVGASKSIGVDSLEFLIYKSLDLGNSWQAKWSTVLGSVNGIYHKAVNDFMFVNDQDGFAVGGNGLFLSTADGGENWTENYISPYTNLSTIYAQSNNKLFTNIAGGIFLSENGGNSWQPQNIILPAIVSKVVFANDSIGYLLAGNNMYKTVNGGVFLKVSELTDKKFEIYPNPTNNSLNIKVEGNIDIRKIQLYSANGKLIKEFKTNKLNLDVSQVVSGNYFLTLTIENRVYTKQIVIN